MIDRSRKRKSLERIRQQYLGKINEIQQNMGYIHMMSWSDSEKRSMFAAYQQEKMELQSKADSIEMEIRLL
jgi:hypothetical protein